MYPFKIFSLIRNSLISKTSKIYPFSYISFSQILDYTYVGYGCKINNTTIGKYCSIAQNVKIGLGKHPLGFVSTSPLFYSPNNPLNLRLTSKFLFSEFEPVIIGNDVWIGTNSTILDGVIIGDGAVIGANSVVTKNVDPYTIVGGVPAKEIKKRFDIKIIEILMDLKWWDYPLENIKKQGLLDFFTREVDLPLIIELKNKLKIEG